MEKADILHLGRLARINITDAEVDGLKRDINSVLEYVSVVNEIATEGVVKVPGAVHNVFRADAVTTVPGEHQAVLLAAMPATKNNMLMVKKILDND